MLPKILCLGNEFVKEDSFAKEVGKELTLEGYKIIDIKDSFQFMEELNSSDNFVILDVAKGIKEVKTIRVEDLSVNKIITSHDLDAQFILKLFNNKNVKIIGIPYQRNVREVKNKLKSLLLNNKS